MRRKTDPITELRRAIDMLPVRTREAMLEGIRKETIIAGAYTDDDHGICPMLAAHRYGGQTTLLSFARTWDRFAGARGVRRATQRELAILEAQLSASLLASTEEVDLGSVIAEHEQLRTRPTAVPETVPAPAAPKRRRASEAPTPAPRRSLPERTYPEIAARRLTPSRVALLRPRRNADARRALERLEMHALAARATAGDDDG